MLSRVLPNWTVQGVVMSSTMGMCKKVKIKLPGQLGVKLWASWLDVLVVELWIILTSTLLWEVKEVFLFFLTPWRRVFNELCVGMCVWSVLWSQFFLHFVSDVQWVALKGKTSWLMFCYFLPLLCSPCFPLLIIPPPSLSLSLSVATRQWRSGRQRCGGRGDKQSGSSVGYLQLQLQPLICDLLSPSNEMWHWKHSFQGNQGVFFFDKVRNEKAAGGICIQRQKTICLSDFFYCQFESAIQVWCYLYKINRIFLAMDAPGRTIPL